VAGPSERLNQSLNRLDQIRNEFWRYDNSTQHQTAILSAEDAVAKHIQWMQQSGRKLRFDR
jgi:hypothetical protein